MELLASLLIHTFDGEFGRIDVGKLGSETVSSSSNLFLFVVKVRSGKKMSEDQFRYVDSVLFVNFDRDS